MCGGKSPAGSRGGSLVEGLGDEAEKFSSILNQSINQSIGLNFALDLMQ